jgi:hypothetical protein
MEEAWEDYTWAPQGGMSPPPGTSASHQRKVLIDVRVPLLEAFYTADVAERVLWTGGYPEGDTYPTTVLEMEKIHPLPRVAREMFAKRFYESDAVEEVVSYGPNQHCLVKPYLGRNRPSLGLLGKEVSMRNFPVYLDDLERMGMNVEYIARELGRAYAVMHWYVFAVMCALLM